MGMKLQLLTFNTFKNENQNTHSGAFVSFRI